MKRKKKLGVLLIFVLIVISACSSPGTQEADQVVLNTDYAEDALSVEMQLIIGSLLLNETDLEIDTEMASSLVPYWKMYLSLEASETTAVGELEAVVAEIQELMKQDQLNYIIGLELTQESMATLMDELGIEEDMMPEGSGTGDGTRPENMQPGEGGGPGSGEDMDTIDPEMMATMQAEREAATNGLSNSRMTAPLIEALISLLDDKIES